MAKTLSTSGINSGQLIKTTQLTQVVDALTGNDGYDITITGSLTVSGSTDLYGATSGSFVGDGSGLTGVTGEWDGSHLGNASITGSLTVTSDLSSSGNLIGTDITASGNISASGDMYASNITFPDLSKIIGEARLTISSSNSQGYHATEYIYNVNGGNAVNIKSDEVEFRKPIDAWYSITASSDISSSGDIIARDFSSSNAFHAMAHAGYEFTISGSHFNMLNQTADKNLHFLTTAGTGVITFGTNNTNNEVVIGTGGHITASSDISASGNVYGVTGSFSHVLGASPLTIESDNFNVDSLGNISGSSISASGTISMLTASIGGGIFTSSSLSTGGGGSTFPFTGDAEITGSLIVSGSGGTDITANNLFLYDGAFGPTGYSYGIKIDTQATTYNPPNTKGGNVSIGASAGNSITDNSMGNIAIGNKAGYSSPSHYNVMIGSETGYNNLGGSNLLMGYAAGYYGDSSHQHNVAIGNNALKGSSQAGNNSMYNTVIGYDSGRQIQNGDNNTILGYKSGYDVTSGGGNIIIGNYAASGSGNMNNQLIIGSASLATISASLTTGDIILQNTTVTNLTASSDISSSGNIKALNFYQPDTGYFYMGPNEKTSIQGEFSSMEIRVGGNQKMLIYSDLLLTNFGTVTLNGSANLNVGGNITASGDISASGYISAYGSSSLTGLPTVEPTTTGSLWISGSSPNHPNSGFLMVYNP